MSTKTYFITSCAVLEWLPTICSDNQDLLAWYCSYCSAKFSNHASPWPLQVDCCGEVFLSSFCWKYSTVEVACLSNQLSPKLRISSIGVVQTELTVMMDELVSFRAAPGLVRAGVARYCWVLLDAILCSTDEGRISKLMFSFEALANFSIFKLDVRTRLLGAVRSAQAHILIPPAALRATAGRVVLETGTGTQVKLTSRLWCICRA